MYRTLLAALGAMPLVVAGAGPASAESVTIPGCFGATTAIYCDVTVSVTPPTGVEPYDTVVPICVVECFDIPLRLPRTTPVQPVTICVSYRTRAGVVTQVCQTRALPTTADVLAVWNEVADELLDTRDNLCDSPYGDELETLFLC